MARWTTGWSGPWGISYSANITPDDETGIGKWTYENFRDTIRNGRHVAASVTDGGGGIRIENAGDVNKRVKASCEPTETE